MLGLKEKILNGAYPEFDETVEGLFDVCGYYADLYRLAEKGFVAGSWSCGHFEEWEIANKVTGAFGRYKMRRAYT